MANAPISIQVIGDELLISRLLGGIALGEEALEAAQAELAEEVATLARSLVPVDTGYLQSTIEVNDEGVGVTAEYAAFVEYGTANTDAQPFLRPAADMANGEAAADKAAEVMGRM